jgi:hypothetical protein
MTKTAALSLLVVSIGASALLMSACSSASQPASTTETTQPAAPAAEVKKGDTTKTGTISKIGEKYFLQESGQQPAEVDSYAVDLAQYVGKKVTVTGQYSGDTLFIGKVE